jgi:hypothetical protein
MQHKASWTSAGMLHRWTTMLAEESNASALESMLNTRQLRILVINLLHLTAMPQPTSGVASLSAARPSEEPTEGDLVEENRLMELWASPLLQRSILIHDFFPGAIYMRNLDANTAPESSSVMTFADFDHNTYHEIMASFRRLGTRNASSGGGGDLALLHQGHLEHCLENVRVEEVAEVISFLERSRSTTGSMASPQKGNEGERPFANRRLALNALDEYVDSTVEFLLQLTSPEFIFRCLRFFEPTVAGLGVTGELSRTQAAAVNLISTVFLYSTPTPQPASTM